MASESTGLKRSFCRICTALCGIVVETDGERVVRVSGDKTHPLTRGYTCPKGRALPRMHHHDRRLERPQMRIGGELSTGSWDACLDNLVAKLKDIIDRHGPSAVGIYFGSGIGMDAAGYKMAEVLQQAIGTPARFSPLTIDGAAKVLISSQVGGFPGFNLRPDYEQARLVIYMGVNPVVSHGHAIAMPIPPSRAVMGVAQRGEVWVIDPRCNETARFGSRHMAPLAGTDYAVLAYVLRELLDKHIDLRALASRASGITALRAAIACFDRDSAAAIAGVPATELDDLLASVLRAGRVVVDTGTGVTMAAAANITQWLAWALMIVTDSMNRPGGAWFHPGYFTPLDVMALPAVPPEALFGPGPPSRAELQGFMGEWPCAALPDEIEAGNIRAFLNLGGNLITAFPDEHALRPALEKLDVMLSLEIHANETTRLSTHVFPTKDQLERPDVTLWDFLSSRVSAQYTPAMVAPQGERRSTWWILAEIVRRLGGEVPAHLRRDDRQPGADEQAVAAVAANGRQSLGEWRDAGYTEVPRELPAPWVDAFLEQNGGWKLAPQLLLDQLAALRNAAGAPTAEGTLLLIPRRQSRHVNAQLVFLGDDPEVLLHPEDARELGVSDGQPVYLRSARGEIEAVAHSDASVRRGVVSVPHGFEQANVNRLTDAASADPVTGMALYSGIPVEVRPLAKHSKKR